MEGRRKVGGRAQCSLDRSRWSDNGGVDGIVVGCNGGGGGDGGGGGGGGDSSGRGLVPSRSRREELVGGGDMTEP
jgi:hypothetical protein